MNVAFWKWSRRRLLQNGCVMNILNGMLSSDCLLIISFKWEISNRNNIQSPYLRRRMEKVPSIVIHNSLTNWLINSMAKPQFRGCFYMPSTLTPIIGVLANKSLQDRTPNTMSTRLSPNATLLHSNLPSLSRKLGSGMLDLNLIPETHEY